MMIFVWHHQATGPSADQTATATMVVEFNDLAACQSAGKAMAQSMARYPVGWTCAAKGKKP